jgi:thiol-disulfide isomerase/thioredoxin
MHRKGVSAALVGALWLCGCATQTPDPPAPLSPDPAPRTAAVPAPAKAEEAVAAPAPTLQAKPKREALYDEDADVKQQIDAALARARKENRRVLIQWGGNWCGWCYALHERFKDPQIKKELLYEYDLVLADAGWDGKNVDFALTYGADLNEGHYPFLTILDASGKPIAQQPTGVWVLSDKNGKSSIKLGHDPVRLFKFLKSHEAPARAAGAVLKAGIDAAKSSGRQVFLHFGAPWCAYCRKLEDWMARPEVSALLSREYVDVKIDQDRMTGAKEVFERYKKDKKSEGIPWIAIVDPATGKAIADSDGPAGNIGFPEKPEEVAHFIGMLRSSATKLGQAELAELQASLAR